MSALVRGRGLVNFSGAALFKPDGPPAADVAARFAERDAREAMDDRDLVARWLGDPPLWRSAFSRRNIGRR